MSNAEGTAKADRSTFHFLYIDSSKQNWYEVKGQFNPPYPAERSLIEDFWERENVHPKYNLIFTHCSNFREAIYSVINHNIDDAYLSMAPLHPFNCPFHGIIFEVKTGLSPENYRWNHFLEDLSRIGLNRLKLNNGLIAFGSRFSDTNKELLMRYSTRKMILRKSKEIFSIEQLKTELIDYLSLKDGSDYFQVERSIQRNKLNQVEYVDRFVRFEDQEHRRRTFHLPRIMVEEEIRYSYLAPPPDNDDFSPFEAIDES